MNHTTLVVTVGHYDDETPAGLRQNVAAALRNAGYLTADVTARLDLWVALGPGLPGGGQDLHTVETTAEAAMQACQDDAGHPLDWKGDLDAADDSQAGRIHAGNARDGHWTLIPTFVTTGTGPGT